MRNKAEAAEHLMALDPEMRYYRCADGPFAGQVLRGDAGIWLEVVRNAPVSATCQIYLLNDPTAADSFDPADYPLALGSCELGHEPGEEAAYPVRFWREYGPRSP